MAMTTLWVSPLVYNIKKRVFQSLKIGAATKGWQLRMWNSQKAEVKPGDILVIWNRHNEQNNYAIFFESMGNKVLVLENPYFKKDDMISTGLNFHNNIKHSFPCLDNGDRFKSFGIDIKPWREKGSHVLICTQAKQLDQVGLGWGKYAQPSGQDSRMINAVNKATDKKIIFRMNPKSNYPIRHKLNVDKVSDGKTPLKEDLKNCHAVVVWTSNSATDALIEGIPVFVIGPGVFSIDCCHRGLNYINEPILHNTREQVFNRMSWNQYSLTEIENGFLFDILTHN